MPLQRLGQSAKGITYDAEFFIADGEIPSRLHRPRL